MTKSTGEIRAGYAEDRAIRDSNNIHPTADAFSAYFSDFDEWLAAHGREVAAKAWDEGYEAGAEDQVNYEAYQASVGSGFDGWTENPYKNGETL